MNDKCCQTCKKYKTAGSFFAECPIREAIPWNVAENYCSEYSPLPDKPGKIEPLQIDWCGRITDQIEAKINELIAAHNGGDGK